MRPRQFLSMVALASCLWTAQAPAPDPAAVKSFLVKLSAPVGTKQSKPGDRIRAAIVSPESLLNGYVEGRVEAVSSPPGRLLLRFDSVLYKGRSTLISTSVTDFVNSKGHKSLDDDEKPVRLEAGAMLAADRDLWLDEGSELRLTAAPRRD